LDFSACVGRWFLLEFTMLVARLSAFGALAYSATAAPTDPEWIAFKAKYQKKYLSDDDEMQRYEYFKASKVRVAGLNELNEKAG
jgi:hypothetical protein